MTGRPQASPQGEDGLAPIELPAGEHEIGGAKPSQEMLAALAPRLAAMLSAAELQREGTPAPRGIAISVDAPELPADEIAVLGAEIAAVELIERPEGTLVAAATGNSIRLVGTDGRDAGTLQTEAEIRTIHWWPEPELLLAGCVDEKVVAFSLTGERKWTFVSEMEPGVAASGKSWWFKQPAHPGIYGLSSGKFVDGRSQCFVGSACTLEILEQDGTLFERLPQTWGDLYQFLLIDAAEGGKDLLAARWSNGYDTLGVINSETLDSARRGFFGVPSGHTDVRGWTATNRTRTLYEDMDGDGTREVAGGINGVWNRVSVWSADGTALYNAQFGARAARAVQEPDGPRCGRYRRRR